MKQKLFALFLIVAVLLAGCSGDLSSDIGANSTPPATEGAKTEVILFDSEKVKVTYIGIKEIDVETIGYSYLNLRIENKTDTEIWVTMPYCNVDKETVPFVIQGATLIYIKPGEIYPATFGIQMFNLSINSLKDAKEITCTLNAVDKENSSNVIFEETIKIDLSK